jgi:putative hydrolase of the HAD superfamily
MTIKAVGFDFFGTLVEAKADWMECISLVCERLQEVGYDVSNEDFISNYRAATNEFRKIRQTNLREVNNRVWVANTLKRMNYDVEPNDPNIGSAVERYFKHWEITLEPEALGLLRNLKDKYKISLVSNFTDSVFLHDTLDRLGLTIFFDYIIDSDTVGWRKPHPNIFKRFLDLSNIRAEDSIFIGDDLETDIRGANEMGIKTVLIVKPDKKSIQNHANVKPDWIIENLNELRGILTQI